MVNVLLLNASFEPLAVVKLSRAIGLLMDGKVEVIESMPGRELRSAHWRQPMPSVLRLRYFAATRGAEGERLVRPWTLAQACAAYFCAANIATIAYPFITIAACNLLAKHGSAEDRAKYLGPLVEGRWFGTMVLSEPQAGSSLADVVKCQVYLRDPGDFAAFNEVWRAHFKKNPPATSVVPMATPGVGGQTV